MVDDSRKSSRINLRLTSEEREQLQMLADKKHKTMSEYLRDLLAQEIKRNS